MGESGAGDGAVVGIEVGGVGKATILNNLTAEESSVAAVQFTALTVVPGRM